MKRYLVIGADGQLGFDLMRTFGKKAVGLTHRDVDITDRQSVQNILEEHKPDVVINVAAISNSERCEKEPDLCFSVNAIGAWNVAKAATTIGSSVVFISSDYVFDGSKKIFGEEDAPSPLNIYGVSKAAGEYLVKIANPKHYIVRSSWFFGKQISHKGHDFPRLMMKLAQERSQVHVVNDQFGSPTYTQDLAEKIQELIDGNAPYGVYHITNQGSCSWYEFAKKIFETFHIEAELVPISTKESTSTIQRPKYSILENTRLTQAGIGLMRPWEEAIEDYAKDLRLPS